MELKDWFEAISYKIKEGSEYGWNCYGTNAYCLDSWEEIERYSSSIIFDNVNQRVYEVYVCDYKNERAYRYINPEYVEKYREEIKSRGVSDEAWENVKWIDLEYEEDFLEKTKAIVAGKDYDKKVMINLNLEEHEIEILNKLAKEANITVDELVEKILLEMMQKIEQREFGVYI